MRGSGTDFWLGAFIMALWAAATTILYTIVLGPVLLLIDLFSKTGRTSFKVGRLWAWLIMKTNRVQVIVEGLEKILPERSYVFISNHTSNLDPLAVAWKLPHTLRFVGKKALEKIPLFGFAARHAGVIFIDRNDTPKAIESINKTIRELRCGISPYFYAEGSRSSGGELKPFKKGGVVLALKARLPIVPITVLDGYKLFPKRSIHIKPGIMRVVIGDPIETSSLLEEDRDKILENVRAIIYRNIEKYDGCGREDKRDD